LIEKLIPEININHVKNIDYIYNGTVGGYASIAKIELYEKNHLNKIKILPVSNIYKFDEFSRSSQIDLINLSFAALAGKDGLPLWFTPDFEHPIEERHVTDKNATRTFYTNANSNIVYVILGGD
jgi:hypothetical protein